jgi:hypothetical protein
VQRLGFARRDPGVGAGVGADNWSYTGNPNDEVNPPTRTVDAVFPSMAGIGEVCAYDRPGVGLMDGSASRSSPVQQPTTARHGVADLHAALASAGLTDALDAAHVTETASGHFIENQNAALVVGQICLVITPATC